MGFVPSVPFAATPDSPRQIALAINALSAGLRSSPTNAATRALMAVLATDSGATAYLTEAGREGLFVFSPANLSASVTADSLQGIYVAPTSASTGASGAWVRQWDGVHGQPEWFGARTGDGAFDNRAALGACVTLCPVTLMKSADYWIAGLWKIQTPYRTVQGEVISDGYTTGNGTRVLSTAAAQNVVQIGPDAAPGSLSDYMRNIKIIGIMFGYGVAITAPGVGLEANAVVVVRPQYLLNCTLEKVSAWEPLVGFKPYGCVRSFIKECKVLRTTAHLGTGDFCRAFWVQGLPVVAAGGNPSLFMVDNALEASSGLAITKQFIYADGSPADLFIDGGECSQATNAVVLNMSGGGNYGRQDIHIRNIVADQCSGPSIDIQGMNAAGTITINGGYFQSNGTASAVILLRGAAGRVSVGGGAQVICTTAGSTIGIHVNSQPNVTIDGTVSITDCPKPVVIEGTSTGGSVKAFINNPFIGDGTQAGVFIAGQSLWHIAPIVRGAANFLAQGVLLSGTANNKVTVDPTGIDLAAISGGVNKVVINATNITAPNYYLSNGTATTTAGTGINVTGITA